MRTDGHDGANRFSQFCENVFATIQPYRGLMLCSRLGFKQHTGQAYQNCTFDVRPTRNVCSTVHCVHRALTVASLRFSEQTEIISLLSISHTFTITKSTILFHRLFYMPIPHSNITGASRWTFTHKMTAVQSV